MLTHDPKKTALLILAHKPDGESEPEKDGPEKKEGGDETDEAMEGLNAAAEDVLSAIRDKSTKGLVSALRSFWTQCEAMEPEGDEGDGY